MIEEAAVIEKPSNDAPTMTFTLCSNGQFVGSSGSFGPSQSSAIRSPDGGVSACDPFSVIDSLPSRMRGASMFDGDDSVPVCLVSVVQDRGLVVSGFIDSLTADEVMLANCSSAANLDAMSLC